MNPRVSVHIPVYNGSLYLRKTLDSIQAQDFPDYEVICVDDCSTDESLSILSEYGEADARFRIVSTERNLGIVPRVLNDTLRHVRGDYWVYASQDDLFSTDWLSSMYMRSQETGADAVIPDLVFFYEEDGQRNRLLSGLNGDRSKILTNREAFVYSLDWAIPGNALWRSHLLREVGFFDFGMNADEYTVRRLFLKSNRVAFSGGTFYYRQDNPDAITKRMSIKTFDIPYTDFMLWKLCRDESFGHEVADPLIVRSVLSLLRFSALTHGGPFGKAADKIDSCYQAYQGEGVSDYLRSSPRRDRKARIATLATSDRRLFTAMSRFLWLRGRARGLLRSS
jgi:glycosyltransferase involved in cell wall biosynthesis